MISVEAGLLAEVDAFAKKHRLKRSELFAKGVRAVMGKW